ncbi:helix-turn-helix domain-containing protein [Deinococcus sp. HMF7620]|uniref:Helix-turn-helix domain-containing protein n=1 Tax=Deinococcus arboris TaxID=2682977 RepID=A0A7C9I0N8_9DEIO|nr:helix-turn-helix transcriptional regulator [Deinococcus arboris]MVN88328.1 helix-turn-helix domain-containing protein [Deinococcus arboris]
MKAPRQIDPVKLKEARENAGDGSKSSAATAAGLTWQGYHLWEQVPGRRSFDWNKFRALCDYLGVSPEAVTVEIEPEPASPPAQALA